MDLTKSERKHTIKKIKADIKNQPREPEFSKDLMDYLSLPEKNKKAMKEKYFSEHGKKAKAPEAEKTEKSNESQESIEKWINNILFTELKKTIDAAKTANQYLFELAKRSGLTEGLNDGIYKVTVTKEEKRGIECTLIGENGYKRDRYIYNNQIMSLKNKNDKVHKDYQGKPEDFLEEFQYNDSCIIKMTDGKEKMIRPASILKEIEDYVNQGRGSGASNTKRIDNIISFLTEGTNIQAEDFMKKIKEIAKKEYKNPLGEKTEGLSKDQENLRNLITTFFTNPNIPIYIHKGKDIDNQAALLLLKKCPAYNRSKKVIAIEQGEEKDIDAGIFLDIGGTTNGVKVENNGKKLTLSEHREHTEEANFADRTNSTTRMLYKILREVKLLPEKELEQLQRFVTFVDKVDGFNYQISGLDYQNSFRTMIGLHKTLAENREIESVYRYFQRPVNTGFERLSDEYLERRQVKDRKGKMISLKAISDKKKISIEENMRKFEELQAQGYTLRYKGGVPFIVDIKKDTQESMKDGPQVASAHKNDDGKQYGFFTIYQQRGNVYIYSPEKLLPEIAGFPTEGHFLIIKNPSDEDLDKLFKEFDTDPKSKEGLKEEIKEYNRRAKGEIERAKQNGAEKKAKTGDQPNKKQIEEKKKQEALDGLPASESLNLKELMEKGESTLGVITNIKEGLGVFVQIGKNYANNKPGLGGLLHINQIETNDELRNEALEKFEKLQIVEVFIKSMRPDGRCDFTLAKPEKKTTENQKI